MVRASALTKFLTLFRQYSDLDNLLHKCLLSEQKQNILIWSKNVLIASKSFPFWTKNSGTKQSNLIWSGNCLGQNRTFLYNSKTYRSKAKCFDLVHLLSELKQNVLIWSAYCRNENKTIWFAPKIISAIQFDTAQTLQHDVRLYLLRRVPLTMLLIYK